jgi:hypothetical protein
VWSDERAGCVGSDRRTPAPLATGEPRRKQLPLDLAIIDFPFEEPACH